jgi:hypothetical protein
MAALAEGARADSLASRNAMLQLTLLGREAVSKVPHVAPAPDCALFFRAGALLTCLTRNEPLQPTLAPVLRTWAASHAAPAFYLHLI